MKGETEKRIEVGIKLFEKNIYCIRNFKIITDFLKHF